MSIDYSALMSLIQQAISYLEYTGLLYFIHAGIIIIISLWMVDRITGED